MSWSLPLQASLQYGLYLELQTKLCQDFTIMEKAPNRAFSWLKVLITGLLAHKRNRTGGVLNVNARL